MHTVHVCSTETTPATNTVREGRKNPQPPREVRCAECELVNDCDCLSQFRLLDLMAPLLRQVVNHLETDGSILDYEVIERLALLADRNDQRVREWNAWPELGDAEDMKCDRVIIEDLVAPWGYEPPHLRTPAGIAALRKVTVERVQALLDRFLVDSRPEERERPEPPRIFSCACTGDHGKTGCSGGSLRGGQCEWCAANHAPAGESLPAWAREVEASVARRAA